MQNHDLENLLKQTCPILPGQESRAWNSLRQELFAAPSSVSNRAWGLAWPRVAVLGLLVAVALFGVEPYRGHLSSRALATADSQSPGVYATAFYSPSAEAQVVWLNGMDEASDRPTYLDPTTEVAQPAPAPQSPNGDPDSL